MLYNNLKPIIVQDPYYSNGEITIQYQAWNDLISKQKSSYIINQGPKTNQSEALSSVLGTELVIIPEIHPQPYPGYEDHSEDVTQNDGVISKSFGDIKEGVAYTVSVLTVLNGKVISQVKKTIIPSPI